MPLTNNSINNTGLPSVLILSDNSTLTNSLLDIIQKEVVSVYLDSDTADTLSIVKDIDEKVHPNSLVIERNQLEKMWFDYLILVNLNSNTLSDSFSEKVEFHKEYSKNPHLKALYVLPFDLDEKNFSIVNRSVALLQKSKPDAAVIFTGDVDTGGGSLLSRIFDYSDSNKIGIFDFNGYLHPGLAESLTKVLVRSLFSMKAYGNKTAVVTKPVDINKLAKALKPNFGNSIVQTDSPLKILNPEVDEIVWMDDEIKEIIKNFKNLGKREIKQIDNTNVFSTPVDASLLINNLLNKDTSALSETMGKYKNNKNAEDEAFNVEFAPTVPAEIDNKNIKKMLDSGVLLHTPQILKKNKKRNIVKTGIGNLLKSRRSVKIGERFTFNPFFRRYSFLLTSLLVAFFVLVPTLLLSVNVLTVTVAGNLLKKGNLDGASALSTLSVSSSSAAKRNSLFLMKTPGVGGMFGVYYNISDFQVRYSLLLKDTVNVNKKIVQLVRSVFDNTDIDVELQTSRIAADLEKIYRELGFVESEFANTPFFKQKSIKSFVGADSINQLRKKVLLVKEVVENSSELLGKGSPSTYLVLFENNLVSRGTGGVLEAIGIATINNGKLLDWKVVGASDVDERTRGYVEAPEPLKKYFDQDEWSVKDYNWDSDFTENANKARWFVDKSLDIKVDGVVSINFETLKSTVRLTDKKLEINGTVLDETNYYNIVRELAGSGLNEQFFTYFSNNLLENIPQMNDNEVANLIYSIDSNFESRNVQAVLGAKSVSEAVGELGWDGEIIRIL